MDYLAMPLEVTAGGSGHDGRSSVTFFRTDSASSTTSAKDDPMYIATFEKIACQLSEIVEIRQHPTWRPIAEKDKHSIPFLVGNALEYVGAEWESKLGHLLPDIFDILLFTVQLEGTSHKYKLDLFEHIPRLMKILLEGTTDAISEICGHLFDFLVSGLNEVEEDMFGEAWHSTSFVLRGGLQVPTRYINRLFPVAKQLHIDKCTKRRGVAVMLMAQLLYLARREKVVQELVPLYVEIGCNDSNNFVRREVATCFGQFCANLTPQENSDHMVILYIMLVQDKDIMIRKMAVDAAPTLLFMLRLLKDHADFHKESELYNSVCTQMVQCMSWITSALKELELSMNISGYKTLGPILAILSAKRMLGLKCDIEGKITFDEQDYNERDYFRNLDSDEKCHDDDNDIGDMNDFVYWNITPSLPAKHITALQKRIPDYSKYLRVPKKRHIDRVTSLYCYTDRITEDTPFCNCRFILLKCFIRYIEYNTHRDIAVICAQNLPCVVYTCGCTAWLMLHPLMKQLAYHDYYKVRQMIAASIHEIFLILDLDVAMRDLCPIYIEFFIDMDQVRICAMNEIHKLLIQPRPDIVSFVMEWLANFAGCISKSECAWRNKAAVAMQLADCMRYFDPKDAMEVTSPVLMKLLNDKVFYVRSEAIRAIARLIILAADYEFIYSLVDHLIEEYGNSDRWKERQACIKAFEEVMNNINPFFPARQQLADRFVQGLSIAAYDPVPNVRLVCARIVCLYGNYQNENIKSILAVLRNDVDCDVRDAAKHGPMLQVSQQYPDLNKFFVIPEVDSDPEKADMLL